MTPEHPADVGPVVEHAAADELLALGVARLEHRRVGLGGDREAVGHRPRQQLDRLIVLVLVVGLLVAQVLLLLLGRLRRLGRLGRLGQRQAVLAERHLLLALGAAAGQLLARRGVEAARGALLLVARLVVDGHLLELGLLLGRHRLPLLLEHLAHVVARRARLLDAGARLLAEELVGRLRLGRRRLVGVRVRVRVKGQG